MVIVLAVSVSCEVSSGVSDITFTERGDAPVSRFMWCNWNVNQDVSDRPLVHLTKGREHSVLEDRAHGQCFARGFCHMRRSQQYLGVSISDRLA